ncbi:MAG TPA: response regulator [Polyangiales bacterium]|nr:response regulator [Polyangiales bacterium]
MVTTEAEFAAHVAHQINNPLTAVIANLDVAISEISTLARDLQSCVSIEERLRDAREAAERLHRTVREMARDSPVPAWKPPPPVPEPSDDHPPRRGRVLVVDDERLIAAAVQRTLAREHEVTALGRARDALEGLRSGLRFDLILCDLMMPEMNGIELHAELIQLAPDQAARMVFLTGGPCTSLAKDFLATVPNPHIEKPFDTRRLRALVAGHMLQHEAVAS